MWYVKWFWIKNVQKWETFTQWGQTRLWLFRVRLNHNVSKYVDLTKFLMLAYFFRWLLWIEIQDYESWRLGICLVVGDWCAKTITGSKFANFIAKMRYTPNFAQCVKCVNYENLLSRLFVKKIVKSIVLQKDPTVNWSDDFFQVRVNFTFFHIVIHIGFGFFLVMFYRVTQIKISDFKLNLLRFYPFLIPYW